MGRALCVNEIAKTECKYLCARLPVYTKQIFSKYSRSQTTCVWMQILKSDCCDLLFADLYVFCNDLILTL